MGIESRSHKVLYVHDGDDYHSGIRIPFVFRRRHNVSGKTINHRPYSTSQQQLESSISKEIIVDLWLQPSKLLSDLELRTLVIGVGRGVLEGSSSPLSHASHSSICCPPQATPWTLQLLPESDIPPGVIDDLEDFTPSYFPRLFTYYTTWYGFLFGNVAWMKWPRAQISIDIQFEIKRAW